MAAFKGLQRMGFATGRTWSITNAIPRNPIVPRSPTQTTNNAFMLPCSVLSANTNTIKNNHLNVNHANISNSISNVDIFQTNNIFSGMNGILGRTTNRIFTGGPLTISQRFYHQAVIDHFNKPRNVGKLDKKQQNVGHALVGKASCGDVIQMQIEVSKDGTVKDAKFKTFGCGSAIASSSLATEMIIGKNLDEAGKLRNTDIADYLNLPPVKIHCSVLAEESIREAIKDYKAKNQG